MKLQLINFGTFENKTFEFENNKFTLFQGENGSGKSTLFKAITFALYDKNKTVSHGKDACRVILSDGFKITRESKPKTLLLEYGDQKYHGTTAQEIIIEKIMNMNYDQFCLSTMINSNTKCSLASITAGDRFNVIRELVSCLDQPRQDIEKLQTYEKNLVTNLDMAKGGYDALTLQLERLKSQNTGKIKPVEFDQDVYDTTKNELNNSREKLNKWLEMISKGITRDEAIEKLDQLNNRENIILKIKNLKENLEYVNHMEKVEQNKQLFENGKKEYFMGLENELNGMSSSSIPEQTLKEWAIETEIRKNARDNGNPHYNKSPDEIKKMATFYIKSSCPHCKGGVGIHNEKLVKWSENMNGNSFDFTKLVDLKYDWDENAPKKWETQVKTRMRMAELKRLIDKQILSNELVRLKKSFGEYLTPPKSFKKTYTSTYLKDRIAELTELLGSYPKESDRHLLETIVSIEKYPTREKITKLNNIISNLEKSFRELEEQRDRYHKYQAVQKLQDQIDDVSKELDGLEKKLNDLRSEMLAVDRLKQLQREAETMSMETVVTTLNTIAADNLSKFFDDMIRVELILYKKTQKNTKMSIELEIEYNGQKYDIAEFSQGETIKINLAFILAMNRLQNSKYLFLDEVLQNLDKDILLEIYSCLHSLCDHMSIFVIQHNSIDGFFDHTIEFKK